MNDRIFILKLREMCAERSNAAGRSEERCVFNEVKTFIENYLSHTTTISEEAFIKRNGRTVLEVKVYPDGNHEEKAVPAKKLLDYAVVAEREGRNHPVPMFATNEWLKGYETGRLDAIQDFRDEVCRALDIGMYETEESWDAILIVNGKPYVLYSYSKSEKEKQPESNLESEVEELRNYLADKGVYV